MKHWEETLGRDCLLDDITEGRLREARATIAKTRAASTVNSLMGVLKIFLNWAVLKGHMRNASYKAIKKLKGPQNQAVKPWWTPQEVEAAIRSAAADEHPVTATHPIVLGCMIGLRCGEIVMQRWQDMDLDAKNPQGKPAPVCHVVPHDGWAPKGGKARTVPIHESSIDIPQGLRRASGYLIEPPRKVVKRGGTKRVYRYDPSAVWKRVLDCAVMAGAKWLTPHCMRHSFASNLLMAGQSDVVVARWLGHADTSLVHERYGHLLAYHPGINAVKYDYTNRQADVPPTGIRTFAVSSGLP